MQVSQPLALDCMIVEQWGRPPTQALMVREQRNHSGPMWSEHEKDGRERSFTMAKRPKEEEEEEGADPGAFWLGRRIVVADMAFIA